MSKNIKIELELPEFENELIISVNLRKDGEVIKKTSSFPSGTKTTIIDDTVTSNPFISERPMEAIWKQTPDPEPGLAPGKASEPVITKPSSNRGKPSGNMMNMNF